jgi:hypothetical protein
VAIDGIPLIDRLVDVAFSVPLTLSAPIRPVHDFVARQHVRVRQDLRNARVVGELAVRFGRRRVEARMATAPRTPAPPGPTPPAPKPAPVVTAVATAAPFDDYDTMPATHIVQRLRRLDPDHLRAAAAYEAAHRSRRTVLGKIEQLLAQ